MKILILSQYFPPAGGSAAAKMYDLAQYLHRNGHHVSVVTEMPNYPTGITHEDYRGKIFINTNENGVAVYRTWVYASPEKQKFLPRFLNYLSFMITSVFGALAAGRHDIIYVYSPPLFLGLTAWLVHKLYRIPFIFMVNDLWPRAAVFLGFLKNKKTIKLAELMEKFIYDTASKIFVYSEEMAKEITNSGVSHDRVAIHPLWIDTESFKPIDNIKEFKRKHDIEGKFTVLHAGNMGFAQGIDNLIEAAKILKDEKDISFFLVGGGVETVELVRLRDRYCLNNVKFMNHQPVNTMPYFFSAADVLFVHLNKAPHRIGTIPEKALAYMSCGRPILIAAEGAAAELVKKNDCGIAVEPQDPRSIADGILLLYGNNELRKKLGKNARKAAVNFFDKNLVLHNVERHLKEIVDGTCRI